MSCEHKRIVINAERKTREEVLLYFMYGVTLARCVSCDEEVKAVPPDHPRADKSTGYGLSIYGKESFLYGKGERGLKVRSEFGPVAR